MNSLLFAVCLLLNIGPVQYVGNVSLDNAEIQQYVREKTQDMDDIDDIVSACSSITKKCLKFSTESKLKSLKQLSLKHKTPTHCVGYAKVFTACCNYAFAINHINAKCYHVRGPMKVAGIDLTKIMSSTCKALGMTRWANFTKDHDYALIKYKGKGMEG